MCESLIFIGSFKTIFSSFALDYALYNLKIFVITVKLYAIARLNTLLKRACL